ncbi:N-acetyltransferase [Nocardioides sp. W3-2-3]|uniref:GNAT family N-acetyltransferase n=1 Tax=Nocardioides convexus TaxID=2712224 RepID=UPI00241825E9|nr:GNAT family N-acetyltransferase [Nocardioides convexus]NHA01461.1 N-acetyltransferase [Nocardioides convexus]
MEVRPAVDADLDAVAAIYDREVREGTATFDLEPPPRAKWEGLLSSAHPGDHFLVADDGGTVLGFAYSSSFRPKGAYDATREVTIYLDPSASRRGIGRRLYDEPARAAVRFRHAHRPGLHLAPERCQRGAAPRLRVRAAGRAARGGPQGSTAGSTSCGGRRRSTTERPWVAE